MNKCLPLFRAFAFVSFVLLSSLTFGQGQANIWYFGQNAGLDFTSGTPVVITNGAMNTIEGCATISDAAGNLLFYTDGQTVWDKTHTAMSNGTGLFGRTSSTQTAMAVNVPGSTTKYYIFTTDAEPNPCSTEGASIAGTKKGLNYSIVDMTLGANGNVVAASKNTNIQADPIMEGMTIVPQSNGIDYWLINHDVGTGSFKVRSVTAGGIGAATTYTTGLATTNACYYISSIKSNSCYTQLAVAYHEYNSVELYDFNFTTGAVSFSASITAGVTFPYGVEFSPQGNYLYYTNDIYASREIWQYDISAATKTLVGNGAPGHVRIGALQLGPDAKIYVANHNWSGTTQIGVIASPNSVSPAGYTAAYLTTGSGSVNLSQMGLPNYVKSYVSNIIDINVPNPICAGSSNSFSFTYTGTINAAAGSIKWQWGDASANTLDQNPATHTYAAGGPYTLTLTIQDNCGVNHVQTATVTVTPIVTPTVTPTQNCASNSVSFAASGGSNYGWWDAATGGNLVSTSNPYVATGISPSTCANIWVQAGVVISGPFTSITTAPATFPPPNDLRLYFDAITDVNITSVSIRPSTYCCNSAIESKNITVRLYNSANVQQGAAVSVTTCSSCAITVGGNPTINQVIPVNFTIPAGSTGWYIAADPVGWSPGFLNQTKSTVTQSGVATFYGDNSSTSMGPFYNVVYSGKTINSCNPRTASSSCCPAPVTWLSFTGERADGSSTVLLDWSTASEQDSKLFYVQRSLDGINYETIGEVGAAGYSTQIRTYAYADVNAPKGNVYYRLLQLDYDGASMKSQIIYIGGLEAVTLSLVPNPGNGNFKIIGLPADTKLDVSVYALTGQSVFTTIAYSGESIDLQNLAKGFYVVKVVADNKEYTISYINQ